MPAASCCTARNLRPHTLPRMINSSPAGTFCSRPAPCIINVSPHPVGSLLCTGSIIVMTKSGARAESGGGDQTSTSRSSELRMCRPPQLQPEQAIETAVNMFMKRAGGPHSAIVINLSGRFTPREISIIQDAVVEAIGERDTEKRARANALCEDGMIDLEQALGYFLFDGSTGKLPSIDESRTVGKNAAKLKASEKEKEKWKAKGKAAREKAKKAGLNEEAMAAARKAARNEAEADYLDTEVKIFGITSPRLPEPPAVDGANELMDDLSLASPPPPIEPDESEPHLIPSQCSHPIISHHITSHHIPSHPTQFAPRLALLPFFWSSSSLRWLGPRSSLLVIWRATSSPTRRRRQSQRMQRQRRRQRQSRPFRRTRRRNRPPWTTSTLSDGWRGNTQGSTSQVSQLIALLLPQGRTASHASVGKDAAGNGRGSCNPQVGVSA